MPQLRRRMAAAGVATLALALITGSAGSAVALDDPPTAPPSYAPSWLALTTSASSSTVTLMPSAGSDPVPTQVLTERKGCELSTSPTLMGFTGDPALRRGATSAGMSNGRIGVRESTTASGTSCSAVDSGGESLTLTLGSGVGGRVAASASLDLDLKGNTRIHAIATHGDGPATTFELRSGTAIDPAQPTGTAIDPAEPTRGYIFNCVNNGSADSGSDNTTDNNCRWEISAPSWTSLAEDGVVFDTLELRALAGSFSLMGGAEGVVPGQLATTPPYLGAAGASYFELVDGVLDCSEGKNRATLSPTGPVPRSTWTRLGNLATGNPVATGCAPYPYSATTGLDDQDRPYAQFNKPLDFEPNAQAIWETTFLYSGNAIPPVYMDLDGDDRGEFQLEPCQASWYTSGTFVGPLTSDGVPNPFACLISATKGKNIGSSKSAIYSVYVYGDATMRR
jgi:hypothetical protein